MSDFNRDLTGTIPRDRAGISIDPGLRKFMLGVYQKLALGLVLAAAIAWSVAYVQPVNALVFNYQAGEVVGYTPIGWAVAFAPVLLILFSNFFLRNLNPKTSAMLYWSVVVLMGASMGVLFLFYTGAAIFSAFLITAISFGGLSLVGYTTKKNLSGLGSFMIMGAWGLFITSIVTFAIPGLFANPMFFFVFNMLGVIVFAGLIAWKTQDLKMTYYAVRNDGVSMAVATNYGALNLFISFVNLFRFILSLMGGRR